MQETTNRGFGKILLAVAFSLFVMLRVADLPDFERGQVEFDRIGQAIQYCLPSMEPAMIESKFQTLSSREGARWKLLAMLFRSLMAANLERIHTIAELNSTVIQTEPIWLINCAMLC